MTSYYSSPNFAAIRPWSADTCRPFWSVMIPTYNCASYLRHTLASVLKQDPGPEQMQIEVIDDCSANDNPEEVVRQLGGDRVSFYRQPAGVGAPRNFNSCVERARGQWVHILHGDDVVRPRFYETYQKFIMQNPAVGMVHSISTNINEHGDPGEPSAQPVYDDVESGQEFFGKSILGLNPVCAPSAVVNRQCYELIGGFDTRLGHTCDWEMWMRISLFHEIGCIKAPLLQYRVHENNDSVKFANHVSNLEQAFLAKTFVLDKFPKRVNRSKELRRRIRREYSQKALSLAHHHYSHERYDMAKALLRFSAKAYRPIVGNNRFIRLSTKLLIGERPTRWVTDAKAVLQK